MLPFAALLAYTFIRCSICAISAAPCMQDSTGQDRTGQGARAGQQGRGGGGGARILSATRGAEP
jgi:hypothetical protein